MTEHNQQAFGERLVRSQPFSLSAAEKYHSEIRALIERRFSRPERWLGIGMGIAYVVFAVLCPLLLRDRWATVPEHLQPFLLFVLPVAFFMFGAAFLWIGIRGRYNRKVMSYGGVLLGLLICGFGGVAMIEQGWAFEDPIARRRLIFAGITMLLILSGAIVVALIEDMHRRTEERLIRIEYRLAELSEKLDRPQKDAGNSG